MWGIAVGTALEVGPGTEGTIGLQAVKENGSNRKTRHIFHQRKGPAMWVWNSC